jgi:hypothetical protein
LRKKVNEKIMITNREENVKSEGEEEGGKK